MTVLASRLAISSPQFVPLRRRLASGLALLGGTAAVYFSSVRSSGLANQGVVDTIGNAEGLQHSEEVGHDCDCAPLWICMQEGRGNCEPLEQKLRSCLSQQKG